MRILVTAFEPFGVVGTVIGINSSEIVLKEIMDDFGDKLKYVVLPVDEKAKEILKANVFKFNPEVIICLGQGNGFRIESRCFKDKKEIKSSFASKIKKALQENSKDNTGRYYCNEIYAEALSLNPKTIFIHIPLRNIKQSSLFVKRVISYILEYGHKI